MRLKAEVKMMPVSFDELYEKAKSVLNPRRLSESAEAGGVGAQPVDVDQVRG